MQVIIDDTKQPLYISKSACELMERFRLPFMFDEDVVPVFDFRNSISISRESMSLLIEYLEGHVDAYYPDLSKEDPVFCEFDKKYFSQFDTLIYSNDSKYKYMFSNEAKVYLDKWIDLYLVMMEGYFDSIDHPLVESLAYKLGTLKNATQGELHSLFGAREEEDTRRDVEGYIEEYDDIQVKKLRHYFLLEEET